MSGDKRPNHFRKSFDAVADEYDAIRPSYPAALIGDIIDLAALPSPADILEVGCGTGQATQPFAQRGDRLTCLDIGASMLAIAQQKFAAYPNVAFQQAAFEEWPVQAEQFDLVMSATAFHWVPPELGYPRAAAMLKPGGSLAIFANEHPPMPAQFAEAMYQLERRLVPAWPDPRFPPELEPQFAAHAAMIDAMGLFAPTIVKTYPWTQEYTTADYLRLANTYSNYRNIPDPVRAELFQAIAELIDREYAGVITKSYLAVLYLARKAPF